MTVRETPEVQALRAGVKRILDTSDGTGQKVGDCMCGVYLFYDYDGEPIYVGQTVNTLRDRIGRHLTGQRSDAVAKSVLDPFEVAEIEMWPFWDLGKSDKDVLNRAEFTVYQNALENSAFNAILNEGRIAAAEIIALPPSVKDKILPNHERRRREHPDIRLARRARTIANLARVISERKVNIGIRRTLWAQAQRLEKLARVRLESISAGKK